MSASNHHLKSVYNAPADLPAPSAPIFRKALWTAVRNLIQKEVINDSANWVFWQCPQVENIT